MARYIDADKKVKELECKINSLTCLIENRPYDELAKKDIGTYESFLIELENTPTADVVEVVRCKDCKFAYKNRFLGEYYCEKTNCKIKQHHFCSCGERRDT